MIADDSSNLQYGISGIADGGIIIINILIV